MDKCSVWRYSCFNVSNIHLLLMWWCITVCDFVLCVLVLVFSISVEHFLLRISFKLANVVLLVFLINAICALLKWKICCLHLIPFFLSCRALSSFSNYSYHYNNKTWNNLVALFLPTITLYITHCQKTNNWTKHTCFDGGGNRSTHRKLAHRENHEYII